jgi:ATP-binding cassette subfamily A (ABC1) protein 3
MRCHFFRICCALSRKNALLKLRTPLSFFLELFLPLVFVMGMVGLSTLFSTTVSPASAYVSPGAGALTILPLSTLAFGLQSFGQLAVLPADPANAGAAAAAAAFVADACASYPALNGSTFGGGFANPALRAIYLPPLCPFITTAYASEAALLAAVRDPNYLADAAHPRVWAAVVFNSGAPSWDYSLRLNRSDVPDVTQTVNTYSTTYAPAAALLYTLTARGMPGFSSLQLAVDRFILRNRSAPLDAAAVARVTAAALARFVGSDALRAALAAELAAPAKAAAAAEWLASEARLPQQVDLLPFPTPQYSTNVFFSQVLYSLTLLFVIAFVYPVSQLIRGLVLEKELRLREALRQMGATDGALWCSWMAVYAALYFVMSILIAVCGIRVFPASNKALIFLLFFLYALAATAFCFLVSVFFTKSRVAAVLGSIIWVAAYFPFFALTAATPGYVKTAASLLAPTALGCAMDVIASLETNGLGATPTTATTQVINNWTLGSSIGMLILDIFLYASLAWYLDAVLPSWARDYGVPRPWYFPLSPSYWREACCGGGRAPPAEGGDGGALLALQRALGLGPRGVAPGAAAGGARDPRFHQALDEELEAKAVAGRCVEVKGLRKVFPTPDGPKTAVDDLDLSFFEGQITCLLGHNGAGKTTVISMLTGLIPRSAGTASVFGRDMFAEQDAVRADLGVCPQHDVLWPSLTVSEHLALFAAIKGVPPERVREEGEKALALVGLTEKGGALVASLSGGMKRKLSVCLAFLGGSRVVFLDEPTSGVDPYSRRSMWNILQSARAGRVIVLTTHFMDEAEILGDRIAIMAGGRAKCSGTPLFLKEAYQSGYTLTLVKSAGAKDAAIVAAVKEFVPAAAVISSAGAELALRLPLSASGTFPPLLRHLEAQKDALGVGAFGMAVASVEDVFMRVANDSEAAAGAAAPSPAASPSTAGGSAAPAVTLEMTDMRGVTRTESPLFSSAGAPGGGADCGGALVPPAPAAGGSDSGSSSIDAVRRLARVEIGAREAFFRHFYATYAKRACFARRDFRAVCCLLLVPLLTLVVGLGLLAAAFPGDPPNMQLSTAQFNSGGQGRGRAGPPVSTGSGNPSFPNFVPAFSFKATGGGGDFPAGEAPSADVAAILGAVPAANLSTDPARTSLAGGGLLLSPAAAAGVDDRYGFVAAAAADAAGGKAPSQFPGAAYALMSAFLLADRQYYAASKYGAYVFTANGTVLPAQGAAAPLAASNASTVGIFFNTTAFHAAPIFTNLYSSALYTWLTFSAGGPNGSIATRNHPLPLTAYQRSRLLAGQAFGSVNVLLICMSYIPAAFAQFLVRERELAAKHQQTISGISLPGYWLANFAWDFSTFLVPFSLCLAIFQAFSIADYMSPQMDRLAAFVMLLLGYGGAGTAFTYLLSHAFKSPSSAQAAVAMMNILFFSLVIAAYVLQLLPNTCTYVPPMRWSLSVLPIYALGEGLSNMATLTILPQLRRACDAANGVSKPASAYPPYTSAFQMDIAGGALCYLAAETLLYLALALWVDSLRSNMKARRRCLRALAPCLRGGRAAGGGGPLGASGDALEDADVAAEAARVERGLARAAAGGGGAAADARADVISLSHLRKEYPGGKTAVRDLSFGVPPGEVFGFLGINGAGKTTTLQMLTGDVLPSAGAAALGGFDIIEEQASVRRLLGYCPQFDALLELLSVREHLFLYGRIKGVREAELPAVVDAAIQDFDLRDYADKLAGSLSGGNKRKTSVACALIGSPPIVFLDEASTGSCFAAGGPRAEPARARPPPVVLTPPLHHPTPFSRRGPRRPQEAVEHHHAHLHHPKAVLHHPHHALHGGGGGALHAHRHHGGRPPALPGLRAAPALHARRGLLRGAAPLAAAPGGGGRRARRRRRRRGRAGAAARGRAARAGRGAGRARARGHHLRNGRGLGHFCGAARLARARRAPARLCRVVGGRGRRGGGA